MLSGARVPLQSCLLVELSFASFGYGHGESGVGVVELDQPLTRPDCRPAPLFFVGEGIAFIGLDEATDHAVAGASHTLGNGINGANLFCGQLNAQRFVAYEPGGRFIGKSGLICHEKFLVLLSDCATSAGGRKDCFQKLAGRRTQKPIYLFVYPCRIGSSRSYFRVFAEVQSI